MRASEVLIKIMSILDSGVGTVGFVSPSHHLSEVLFLIDALHQRDFFPVFVYNTNSFDSVKTIQRLNGLIDVYLPDFKYALNSLAFKLSGVKNYPTIALKSLKQMYFQKGNQLMLDESDIAISGLIIRHLVLPGQVENSIRVLKMIAEEVSPNISISLMAQYNPILEVQNHLYLGRSITAHEYQEVVAAFYELGFSKGWVQAHESKDVYNPDFSNENPFGTI
jgi:putative pyruvate formate lyase activating enzyme